jgi:hypothetical protein
MEQKEIHSTFRPMNQAVSKILADFYGQQYQGSQFTKTVAPA